MKIPNPEPQIREIPHPEKLIGDPHYIENDLKGNENCFELAASSSYRGFELPEVDIPKYRFFIKVPLRCLPSNIVADEEGRKKGRVQYVYLNDLFNARCNATRCSFAGGKKGVTKTHLRADSSRSYLPNGERCEEAKGAAKPRGETPPARDFNLTQPRAQGFSLEKSGEKRRKRKTVSEAS